MGSFKTGTFIHVAADSLNGGVVGKIAEFRIACSFCSFCAVEKFWEGERVVFVFFEDCSCCWAGSKYLM